ncbi:McrB family protein [Lolliginicoccus levis]|uniref:McrB family protein n=1 Tax=Lolliginicoccus levis TaxID=2919542 RepID=UPI00241C9348|nr:AAA family ATPase [Lolliginicoccus levis]
MYNEGTPHIAAFAHRLFEECLLGQGSILTPGVEVWTRENLEVLKRDFVDRPDETEASFYEKLETQLDTTPPRAVQLFAELAVLNVLPLTDYTASGKETYVSKILAHGDGVTIPDDVRAIFRYGACNGSLPFKTRRPFQLQLLVLFALHFQSLPRERQLEALKVPQVFREIVEESPGPSEPSQRHALMYLAHPDYYVPILSTTHRKKIRAAFAPDYLAHPPGDVWDDLHEITVTIEEETGERPDFYFPPWQEKWRPTATNAEEATRSTDVQRAWLVRGSSVAGRNMVHTWLTDGFVSLAASKLRTLDLDAELTLDDIRAIVREDYAHTSYAAQDEKAEEFHAFITRMHPGDFVCTVSQGNLFLGEITGDAQSLHSDDNRSNLRRAVSWFGTEGVDYADLHAELQSKLSAQRDVIDFTQFVEQLRALTGETEAPREELRLPDATAELATSLHVSQSWLQECIELLRDRPQMIFYGPPGTGKTYIARELAKHLAGDNVKIVQFHPAYSYEDFFEGYRPSEGTNGSIAFSLKPGPLRKLVDQAREDPTQPYVLIIDEINRGNLAKIFGELYFLLEYRDQAIDLLYGTDKEGFTLPTNVFLIGTMNTADRSIALVDSAMRRRFAFLPLHPTEHPTNGVLRSWLGAQGLPSEAANLLEALNARIDDADFKIGPSYFMRSAVHQPGGFERVWRTAILPLLEEHHYGDGTDVLARYGLDTIRRHATTSDETDNAHSDAD